MLSQRTVKLHEDCTKVLEAKGNRTEWVENRGCKFATNQKEVHYVDWIPIDLCNNRPLNCCSLHPTVVHERCSSKIALAAPYAAVALHTMTTWCPKSVVAICMGRSPYLERISFWLPCMT